MNESDGSLDEAVSISVHDGDREHDELMSAITIGNHIDEPRVCPKTGKNIRQFYIQLAKDAIKNYINPYAIDYLKSKIKEYE